uniref:Uncharacterized protein n=1 Tax=Physcomitrium patens TaxID=3218 RepID=A0A7I3Z9Z6_PHYPA
MNRKNKSCGSVFVTIHPYLHPLIFLSFTFSNDIPKQENTCKYLNILMNVWVDLKKSKLWIYSSAPLGPNVEFRRKRASLDFSQLFLIRNLIFFYLIMDGRSLESY